MFSFIRNAYDQVHGRGILGFVSSPGFTPTVNSTLTLAPAVTNRCQPCETEAYIESENEESETDVAVRFAAWEKEQQAQELRSAADLEGEACRLFTQATLVRHAVLCEEDGLSELAGELRRRAESLAGSTTSMPQAPLPREDGIPF